MCCVMLVELPTYTRRVHAEALVCLEDAATDLVCLEDRVYFEDRVCLEARVWSD